MTKDFETYYLAKTWKRIIARIIDIIVVSLITGVIIIIWFLIDKDSLNNQKTLLIMIIINYLIFSLYFIIIPWIFNGQTLGKKIFLIKLVQQNNQKIPFKAFFFRETILVFIPTTLAMLSIVLTNIFLDNNLLVIEKATSSDFWISVFIRIIYSFIAAWFLGIMITVKIDKKHQLFYDRKFCLYVINKYPLTKKLNSQEIKTNSNNIVHIHLGTTQPGNISKENLNEIKEL